MKLLKYLFGGGCPKSRPPSAPHFGEVCRFTLLNSSTMYAGVLGVLGVVLCLYDILTYVSSGNTVLCTALMKGDSKADSSIISPTIARDLKLISLVLSMEYYLFLIIGALIKNATFFIPWMIFYSIIISLEFLLFLSRTLSGGLSMDGNSFLLSVFVIYNWLAIFCAFLHCTGKCK